MKGAFITFEGIEGCGKTTQITRLEAYLRSRGCDVVLTREPGGTELGTRLREILLDPANEGLCPVAELLLYEADRAQHVEERIRPALARGAVVLCDRFFDSTTAYQGAGRSLDPGQVAELHRIATRGCRPGLTILLDLDAAVGLGRTAADARDRMERQPQVFHKRVRQGFLDIAAREPGRVRIVNGDRPVDTIAEDVRVLVGAFLDL